ncbi:unnamed protein product [Urochloa decumbens]|uniref:Uncharacterized protein n=1 Tax=Urochloa decumbens TaxID=240449 RepID=A0ABC9GVQ2_9POAL
MNRRFVNLVMHYAGGQYSVHHLDASQLFYKSTEAAAKIGKQAIKEFPELRRVPAASFQFKPFRSSHYHLIRGADLFGPFGDSKILCVDGVGHNLVYDTVSHSAQAMPMMHTPKGPMAISLSIPCTQLHATSAAACEYYGTDPSKESYIFQRVKGNHSESVYIMDMSPRCLTPFEVLSFSSKGWLWRHLPPPPFLRDPMYEPRWDSAVAVKGNTIFVSPSIAQEKCIGTYSFDTVTQKWDKAGEWVLPFLGKAEFVPEFGLWFGFSPYRPYNLCATGSLDSPEVKSVFADLVPPEDWSFTDLYLVYLGSGRFCTAKYYHAGDDDAFDTGFVFNGVEVVHHDRARELRLIKSNDYQTGELLMIKHKSKCATNIGIKCVL